MTRRCSHCGHNGHNSRTCPDRGAVRGVRLFGVRLTANDGTAAANMRKSVSMGNLTHYASNNNPPSPPEHSESAADGYVSDGMVQTSNNARERKKGVPWTEEEHRLFLLGLQKLGKGDWRGISRNYVQTRTPTQVASHAQKYFIRQSNLNKRKRRSSLFDIVSETSPRAILEEVSAKNPADLPSPIHQLNMGTGGLYSHGSYFDGISRGSDVFGPMLPIAGVPPRTFPIVSPFQQPISLPVISSLPDQNSENAVNYGGDVTVLSRPVTAPVRMTGNSSVPVGITATGPPIGLSAPVGFSLPVWGLPQGYSKPASSNLSSSKVVKPTACPAKIDEGSEMAKLTLGPGPSPSAEPSNLTLKLLEQHPTRTSAFQLKTPFNNSSLGPSTISVV